MLEWWLEDCVVVVVAVVQRLSMIREAREETERETADPLLPRRSLVELRTFDMRSYSQYLCCMTRKRTRFVGALLAILMASCASFESDMQKMCNVDAIDEENDLVGNKFDPRSRISIYIAYAHEEFRSADGKALLEKFVAKPKPGAAQRLALVRAAAKKAGVPSCAILSVFEEVVQSEKKARELENKKSQLTEICEPSAELVNKLGTVSAAEGLKLMDKHYSETMTSNEAKSLYRKLSNNKLEPKARHKLALAAMRSVDSRITECVYTQHLVTVATELLQKGEAIMELSGNDRDVARAKKAMDEACEMGLQKACRQAVGLSALLPAKK